jgi:hypothetical protein
MGFENDFPKEGVSNTPAVYAFRHDPTGDILYIGQSKDPLNRVGNHLMRKGDGYLRGKLLADPDSGIDPDKSNLQKVVTVFTKKLQDSSKSERERYESDMKMKYNPEYDNEC